ncbi:MAG: type II toxin-antitoxin system HicB family antitoxin [Blastocatellia bacterium]|nr:type II toxin-antitoxin system HicB family antitoxin [Blastocatellia bacterium]
MYMLDEYDFSNLKGVRGKYAGRPVSHNFTIELDCKEDRCWVAEIPAFGVEAHGQTREEVISRVQGLAFRVLADRIEQGKAVLGPSSISFSLAE